MGYVFKNNILYILHDKEIVVGTLENFLYFLVGNEILPLNPWFIRPYPGKLLEEEKFTNINVVVILPTTLLFI